MEKTKPVAQMSFADFKARAHRLRAEAMSKTLKAASAWIAGRICLLRRRAAHATAIDAPDCSK